MTWKQVMPGVFEGIPGEQQEETALELCVRLSNIPLRTMKSHRIMTWQHRDNESWWPKIEQYADGSYDHPFLTFLGIVGTGKTHLALAIGWEWLERGKTVLYYQAAEFLDSMRDALARKQSGLYLRDKIYEETTGFAKNTSLFILDDLGAEKETEWSQEQLDLIVNFRYVNRKPLIVTSNLALDCLPPRIADRLAEGQIIHLKGSSFRRQKK